MSLLAQFDAAGISDDRRSSDRRALRLTITAALPESPDLAVTIHDLSETGLLLETRVGLSAGQQFEIFLPLAGAVETKVVWSSHNFHGCQFGERVPKAAVSAALLQSVPKEEAPQPQPVQGDVLSQLRDLNARIEQVGEDLDRTIERLSHRSSIPSRHPDEVLAAALPKSPILPPPEAEIPEVEPRRYAEQDSFEVRAATQPVVIISLILAGLAALMLIAALLAFPLSS